jgi:hypothetical protein
VAMRQRSAFWPRRKAAKASQASCSALQRTAWRQ